MRVQTWVGAVIYRRRRGIWHVLLQESVSTLERYENDRPQVKNIGGEEEVQDHNDHDKGVFINTLRRELMEEAHLRLKQGFEPKKIYHVNDNMTHGRVSYLVPFNRLSGQKRTESKVDGTSRLLALRWYTFEEAKRVVYRTHLPILVQAEFELSLEEVGLVTR